MNTIVGKEVIVKDKKHGGEFVGGIVVDDNTAIRLQTGEHSGEILKKGEYDFFEVLGRGEPASEVLNTIWTS